MDGHANFDKFGLNAELKGIKKLLIEEDTRYRDALKILLNLEEKEDIIDKIVENNLFEMKVDLILLTDKLKKSNIEDIIKKIEP